MFIIVIVVNNTSIRKQEVTMKTTQEGIGISNKPPTPDHNTQARKPWQKSKINLSS